MRSIRIGERKLSDMKPEEFLDFVYEFGYCGSDEFWNKPVLMQFEFDKVPYDSSGQIYFTFYQTRKKDEKRMEKKGHLFFGSHEGILNTRMGIYLSENDDKSSGTSYHFDTKAINHFLKLGFDLPIYSDFCVEW